MTDCAKILRSHIVATLPAEPSYVNEFNVSLELASLPALPMFFFGTLLRSVRLARCAVSCRVRYPAPALMRADLHRRDKLPTAAAASIMSDSELRAAQLQPALDDPKLMKREMAAAAMVSSAHSHVMPKAALIGPLRALFVAAAAEGLELKPTGKLMKTLFGLPGSTSCFRLRCDAAGCGAQFLLPGTNHVRGARRAGKLGLLLASLAHVAHRQVTTLPALARPSSLERRTMVLFEDNHDDPEGDDLGYLADPDRPDLAHITANFLISAEVVEVSSSAPRPITGAPPPLRSVQRSLQHAQRVTASTRGGPALDLDCTLSLPFLSARPSCLSLTQPSPVSGLPSGLCAVVAVAAMLSASDASVLQVRMDRCVTSLQLVMFSFGDAPHA